MNKFRTVLLQYAGSVSVHFFRNSSSSTHYIVLGVPSNATKAEVRAAFISLSKKHHPDRSHSKDAHKRFSRINEAYSVLVDPAKRSIYDQQLFYDRDSRSHSSYQPTPGDHCGFYNSNAYTYTRAYSYNDVTDEQWKDYESRILETKRNNLRIVALLLLITVCITTLEMVRIHHTHKQRQKVKLEQTRRLQNKYEAVLERARRTTLQEKLDRLARDGGMNSAAEAKERAKKVKRRTNEH